MKKCFVTLLIAASITANAQDLTFNNIHKLVDAKKYREAISQLRNFIKTEPKHVSAHYDLGISYWGLLSSLATIQNANVKNQNTTQWSDKEYQENLNFWKCGINYTDSAIYYYKETSQLMNLKFLELDLRYPEIYEATKDCGVISMVKCARNYLAGQVDILESVNAENKSKLFNVEKDYEEFKKNNPSNNEVDKLVGSYFYGYNGEDECKIQLVVSKKGDKYFYLLVGKDVNNSGGCKIDDKSLYLVFDNNIAAMINDDWSLTIQNSGNSDNKFVIFKNCGEKFITFKK